MFAGRVPEGSRDPASLDLHSDERLSVGCDEVEFRELSAHSPSEHAPPESAQVASGESLAAQTELRPRGGRELQEELGRKPRQQDSD